MNAIGDPRFRFHHIGVACHDLIDATRRYELFGYTPEGPLFEDSLQRIRGRFLIGPGTRIELVEPTSPESPVQSWLKQSVHCYHLAYEVDDLDGSIAELRRAPSKLVVNPVPASGLGGRRIAFLLFPRSQLVELIGPA